MHRHRLRHPTATRPNGPWTTVNDGVSTNTSFTVTGLFNGSEYFFRGRRGEQRRYRPVLRRGLGDAVHGAHGAEHLKAKAAATSARSRLQSGRAWSDGGAP